MASLPPKPAAVLARSDALAVRRLRTLVNARSKRARVSLTLRLICGYRLRSLLPFLTCIYETLLDLEIYTLEHAVCTRCLRLARMNAVPRPFVSFDPAMVHTHPKATQAHPGPPKATPHGPWRTTLLRPLVVDLHLLPVS